MSSRDLDYVEDFADDMFRNVNIDVEFTRHFIDRVNDSRNNPEIESNELMDLFSKLYKKYGQKLPNFRNGTHAVVRDMNSNLNIPFELYYDKSSKQWELRNMTIMRKKHFKTPDPMLKV